MTALYYILIGGYVPYNCVVLEFIKVYYMGNFCKNFMDASEEVGNTLKLYVKSDLYVSSNALFEINS